MRTENIREVALEEIIDLPVHPVADIFPLLAESSTDRENGKADKQTITLAELADSIIANGLQEPIVLFRDEDGNLLLLDGRNRRAACILGKIETVLVEDFIGSNAEAEEYILNLNIDRRDLTPGQRAFAAAAYWDMEAERAKARQGTRTDLNIPANLPGSSGDTRDQLARRFRCGQKYVDVAHKQIEEIAREFGRVEKLQAEAEELEIREKEAEAKLELAKATGDTEVVKEAVKEKSDAANKKIDLREAAAAVADKAAQKQRKADRVKRGESFNSVYGEQKQKEQTDDPIAQLRTRINSGFANLKQAVTDLAKAGGQGEDDWNFVSRKIDDFIRNLEEAFDMEV